MRYFRMALQCGLRRQFRRPGTYLLILASLCAALAFRWTPPPPEGSQPVRVGVSLPEEGREALWTALESRENGAVRFIPADGDTVRAQVAASRWDCGLIFPEDFFRRLAEEDLEKSVTLVTGPGSAAWPLVQETAAAVLAGMVSPGIAAAYLEEQGMAAGQSGGGTPVPPVEIALETLDGTPLTQQSLSAAGRERLLLGVLAAGELVWTLFAAMDLGRWQESAFARRLRPCLGRSAMLLPRLLSALLPAWCSAALGLWIALGPGALPGLGMLAPYFFFLGALTLVVSRRIWRALPALIPYGAAASLVLSPWLVDVPALFPALAPVCRYLPVTLYLSGCAGEARAGWTLVAMAGLLLAANAGSEK